MALVETVQAITKRHMLELAETIEREMKAEASKHKASNHAPTGAAAASIHIEEEDEAHIFVGAWASFSITGNDGGTHLYYMDQGNRANGADGRIHPIRAKALRLRDGTIKDSVRPYSGRGFIAKIAARHR